MFENKENKLKNVIKRASLCVLVLILIFSAYLAGLYMAGRYELIKDLSKKEVLYLGELSGKYSKVNENKISQDIDFNLFWQVWDTMKKEYVKKDELTDKQMFYGALAGLVASANDPYTIFMDPKITREFEDDLAGTFEGIGAEISIKKDVLMIVAPLPETPAQKAGLKAGDKIYAINGTSTMGMSVDEAVSLIRGPKGSQVILTIFRDGQDKTTDFTVTRDTIIVKSISTELRNDNIFVLKVSSFNDDTQELFEKSVFEILQKNPKGIILDLRNNPGGYLETAIVMASYWVEKGIVVSEKFNNENKNDYQSRGIASLKGFKTVVLVNEGSASASEIVAGALKDHGKATIIGKKTFGKGSVQSMENLSDGSSIKITVAEWLTPNGVNINKEGIQPDIEVDLSKEDYDENKDPQLDKAISFILENKK